MIEINVTSMAMDEEIPKKTGENGSIATRFKPGNAGKPAGATNKLTRTVKEAVLDAFNELQEDEDHNLNAFARKHPRDFYAIAAKLIPTDIRADVRMTKVSLEIIRTITDGTINNDNEGTSGPTPSPDTPSGAANGTE